MSGGNQRETRKHLKMQVIPLCETRGSKTKKAKENEPRLQSPACK
jgi:hypothetical protein